MNTNFNMLTRLWNFRSTASGFQGSKLIQAQERVRLVLCMQREIDTKRVRTS